MESDINRYLYAFKKKPWIILLEGSNILILMIGKNLLFQLKMHCFKSTLF